MSKQLTYLLFCIRLYKIFYLDRIVSVIWLKLINFTLRVCSLCVEKNYTSKLGAPLLIIY